MKKIMPQIVFNNKFDSISNNLTLSMDFISSIARIMEQNYEKQSTENRESVEIRFVISNQYLIPEYKKTINRKIKKKYKI